MENYEWILRERGERKKWMKEVERVKAGEERERGRRKGREGAREEEGERGDRERG